MPLSPLSPHQANKVDISSLNEQELKLFRLYGKMPVAKKNIVKNSLMERKYFDSGDYALSKAGKTAPQSVGTAIPSPESIPHASPPGNGQVQLATSPTSASPIGESGLGATITQPSYLMTAVESIAQTPTTATVPEPLVNLAPATENIAQTLTTIKEPPPDLAPASENVAQTPDPPSSENNAQKSI